MKQSTTMESLRCPLDNQILRAEAMISRYSINLPNIIFVDLLKKELDQLKNKMEKR